jgi:hypothetical protein
MKKYLLLIFLFLNINSLLIAQEFKIDKFNDIPSFVDGCSCYFYLNNSDFNNVKNFIFISSAGGDGAMKINGEIQKFYFITDSYENGYYAEYSNKEFEIKITAKQIKEEYEWVEYEGFIKIKNYYTGYFKEIHIIGGCGC